MDTNGIKEGIMEIINFTAEKLGVAVEHVYPVLVKQAYIEGFVHLSWVLLGVTITSLSIWGIIKIFKNVEGYERGEYFTIILIPLVIGLMIITFTILPMLTAFFNPDWYVINNLLKNLIH